MQLPTYTALFSGEARAFHTHAHSRRRRACSPPPHARTKAHAPSPPTRTHAHTQACMPPPPPHTHTHSGMYAPPLTHPRTHTIRHVCPPPTHTHAGMYAPPHTHTHTQAGMSLADMATKRDKPINVFTCAAYVIDAGAAEGHLHDAERLVAELQLSESLAGQVGVVWADVAFLTPSFPLRLLT